MNFKSKISIIKTQSLMMLWTNKTVRFIKSNFTNSLSFLAAAAVAKSLQSCPTLSDPRDGSPPGSPIPGILQARTLEWVAISFSNAWTWKVKMKSLSRVQLLATPWTAAYQAPPSMGFSRQEYWSGVPLPSPVIRINKSQSISHLENKKKLQCDKGIQWFRHTEIELALS